MKIAFFTLGCKVNQFETQALRVLFSRRGHECTEDTRSADAIIINTCTVTAVSDKKSRQLIRRVNRENPDATVAVCGCLSQVSPGQVLSIPGVDIIAGTGEREKLVDALEKAYSGEKTDAMLDNPFNRREYEILPAGGESDHTRAFLKICDGCENFCAYCIIPYARGPVRSLSTDAAVSQAKELESQGFREIVITGIEISSYGVDLSPPLTLTDLVEAVCAAVPGVRVRLGSLEPRMITKDFTERLSKLNNLCPHFHVSLQSGCDETLKRMRRKYDTRLYFDAVSLLRESFLNCAITTDLIAGFPGETEAEFNKTLEFIEKCGFADMHIFPYSRRANTPAYNMENQIPRAVKAARAKAASDVARKSRESFLNSQIGLKLNVLWEEFDSPDWAGHSENYIKVYANAGGDMRNKISGVLITGVFKDGLRGEITRVSVS